MKNLQFSIVMPIKNGSATIANALNSLLKQTYKNFEIIIVDDGSTDKTAEIVKKFKRMIISLPKSYGAAYARNKGVEKAKGEFLVFMDADIILFKNSLEKAKEYILKNPQFSVFFGTFTPKIKFKNIFSQYKHLYLCYYYLKQDKQLHTIDTSLAFIKKQVFDKFKFNHNVKISEDTELGMRLTKAGYFITRAKSIKMKHVKFYSAESFIKTDFVRGMRFSRLFLKSIFKDREDSGKKTFFLKPLNIYLNVGLMPFIILFLLAFLIFNNLMFFSFFIILLASFGIINFDFWNYLRKKRGLFFVFKSGLITFMDAIIMDVGILITFLKFLIYGRKILE